MRRFVAVVLIVGVVVTLVVGGIWALQNRLIYFPATAPLPPAATVITGARDVTLTTDDGLALHAWFVPPSGIGTEPATEPEPATDPDPAPHASTGKAVLLAHGNGGDIAGRAPLAEALRARGLAVLLLEYRGYGGNPGTPSEDGLALDAEAALTALRELGYPPERVVLFGESLGTGVVARLAAAHDDVAAVVLRSPFTELGDVGAHHYPWLPVRQLLRDRYPVSEYLTSTTAPLAVIHGKRDSVVPVELSRRVAEEAPFLVEHVVLDGDHNDAIMFGPEVADVVARMATRR